MAFSYKNLPECAKVTLEEKIQKLSDENITKIEISLGYTDYDNLPKFSLNNADIKTLKNFLKHAGNIPVGGHNHTNYECYLTFYLESGVKQIYYGGIYTQYDWNKDALYLSYPHISKNGSYWYRGQGDDVYVPSLGKWLREKFPKK